jgi:hypothetical protein
VPGKQQREIDQQKDAGREQEIEDAKKAAAEQQGEGDDDELSGRSTAEIRENPELREKAEERARERGAELIAARANPDVTERFAGGTPGGASESQQAGESVHTLAGTGPVLTGPLDPAVAQGVTPRSAMAHNPSLDYDDDEAAQGGDEGQGKLKDEA